MSKLTFTYQDRSYELSDNFCSGIFNDDLTPIKDFSLEKLIELIQNNENLSFAMDYYDEPCDNCHLNTGQTKWSYSFLECHFFLFTKNNEIVLHSLAPEYEAHSFEKLAKAGIADQNYLISIIVCPHCNDFTIELELADY